MPQIVQKILCDSRLPEHIIDIIDFYVHFKPQTREELDDAIYLYLEDKDGAIKKYGIIGTWNTYLINDMSNLFIGYEDFDEDISNWDVSNVTNMESMFVGCIYFNQPLNKWDVSNVTNM